MTWREILAEHLSGPNASVPMKLGERELGGLLLELLGGQIARENAKELEARLEEAHRLYTVEKRGAEEAIAYLFGEKEDVERSLRIYMLAEYLHELHMEGRDRDDALRAVRRRHGHLDPKRGRKKGQARSLNGFRQMLARTLELDEVKRILPAVWLEKSQLTTPLRK